MWTSGIAIVVATLRNEACISFLSTRLSQSTEHENIRDLDQLEIAVERKSKSDMSGGPARYGGH